MKKIIFLLILSVLSCSLMGQDIEKAQEYINAAQHQLNLAEEALQKIQGIPTITAEYLGEHRFNVYWEPFQSDTSDIQFFSPQLHSDTLKVNDFHCDPGEVEYCHNNPPNTMVGFHPIQVSNDPTDKEWNFRLVTNYGKSNVCTLYVSPSAPPEEVEIDKDLFIGWWDSLEEGQGLEDYPYANTIKTYADNVEFALDTEVEFIVPYIGIPDNMSLEEVRRRLRNKGRFIKDIDPSKIPFVILQDEPDSWDNNRQNKVVEIAKEEINSDFCYTYSFSGNHIWNRRPIGHELECIHVNTYPFRGEGYPSPWGDVRTKEEFMDVMDEFFGILNDISPDNSTFSITTQTFAQRYTGDNWDGIWQWAEPPSESPIWYYQFMSLFNSDDHDHTFTGGLHYLLRRSDTEITADDMPGLMESVEIVFQIIEE